jgi:hypothetical protein
MLTSQFKGQYNNNDNNNNNNNNNNKKKKKKKKKKKIIGSSWIKCASVFLLSNIRTYEYDSFRSHVSVRIILNGNFERLLNLLVLYSALSLRLTIILIKAP